MMFRSRYARLSVGLLWLIGLLILSYEVPVRAQTEPTAITAPTTESEPNNDFAAAIPESEPNNTSQQAQTLSAIGLDNPVSAAINTPGDTDWYKFEVTVGRTYAIQVYNLDVGLGRAGGSNCERFANHIGLGLIVSDTSLTELRRQCAPFASGNVQNSLVFKATATGFFYLMVVPQSSAANVFGSYSLRILPKHDEPGASWDNTTAEPNDRNEIAYEILPGLANAQTRTIAERNVAYTTSFVDIDVYRINAVQGRTYVVELFNVDAAIASDGGANCERFADHHGLAMVLYQPDNVEVARQCALRSTGNVHNSLQFTAQFSGPYYVNIYPHANTTRVFGTYQIRVLPKYDEPDAAWDPATFEPNNRLTNAYAINIGRLNAISSTIEARPVGYSTQFTDIDVYRFQGEADQRYVVELFNVNSNLGTQGGSSCERFADYRGLALFVFSPVRDAPVAGQCRPGGHGNVHSIANFTADATGQFFVQVYANSNDVSGSYQLRVLPAYDQPTASWDIALEPNNRLANAYPIPVDPCGVQTLVEQRRASFLTNNADVDWFVFQVVEGTQYNLDLSEIAATLQVKGMHLQLFNQEGAFLQENVGKASARIKFTAGYTGPYYAWVWPELQSFNVPSISSGLYRISVSDVLSPGCNGEPPPTMAVDGAISTAQSSDGRLVVVVSRGGSNQVTLTIEAPCSNGTAQTVTLSIGAKSFPMTAIDNARYSVTLNLPGDLPTGGSMEITAHYVCNGQKLDPPKGRLELFDPSGQITDQQTGQPISNAIVTLYRVNGAVPDSNGQTRDCRTLSTRGGNDWSHLPPADLALGTLIDPLIDALNGIQQINPQANPQRTGSAGRYAWDVVEGCWFVVVEAEGYTPVVSPLVGIPPAVTDLNMQLTRGSVQQRVYLPTIRR